jgi:hypothetical protein
MSSSEEQFCEDGRQLQFGAEKFSEMVLVDFQSH